MRRLLIAAITAASLAGCATNPTTGVQTFDLAAFTAAVQQLTSAAGGIGQVGCSFLPTAETIANIVATGNPVVSTVNAVANAICAAVSPAKVAGKLRATAPTVAGVAIHGRFLK